MTGRRTTDVRRAAIDRRLDTVLESASTETLAPARTVVSAYDERWYGQLVGCSADALVSASSARPSVERLRGPAAAVELLRGYCALRCAIACDDADDPTGLVPASRLGPELTAPLLSGDYLFAAAHATLDEAAVAARPDGNHERSERRFDVLTRTTKAILETVGKTGLRPESVAQYTTLIDGVAGTLGECAAHLGATLTPIDRSTAASVATVCRAASSYRQLLHVLPESRDPAPIAPFPLVDALPDSSRAVDRLRRRAEGRRETAVDAIESLSADVDESVLWPLVERSP